MIPYYGNWIELISNNSLYFIFDKKLIFLVKNILISIGLNKKFFFNYFFFKINLKIIKVKKKKFFLKKKKFFFNKKYNNYFCFSCKKIINFHIGDYYLL
ncbi:hypothetical protein K5B08_01240, partial [Candidatus Carsonella ruddii]|nr:hypothetical protein [Candidatus Carsonella ruddii]